MVQVQSLMVQEGGSALLVCSCKADPPASEYRWSYSQHGRTVHLHQRTHTVRVFNVTRDMRVRCSAQNLIGRGESRPTTLNIQCNICIRLVFKGGCQRVTVTPEFHCPFVADSFKFVSPLTGRVLSEVFSVAPVTTPSSDVRVY